MVTTKLSKIGASELIDLARPAASVGPKTTLMEASYQWATRPDDQRYERLTGPGGLLEAVVARRERSLEFPNYPGTAMEPKYVERGPLQGNIYFASFGDKPAITTNWSFSQYNSLIGGPPITWLRDVPPPEAVEVLKMSLRHRSRLAADSFSKVLAAPPDGNEPGLVRAVTSPSYGRIWDEQVVRTVIRINHDGRWVVPGQKAGRGMADMYKTVTKQSTTLYASDRDVWLFLVDESHPVEIDGEVFFRGFIVSNSEVGNATFRLMAFYLQAVCMNRMIHGAAQIRELRVRHTSGAPTRFIEEAAPALAAYSNASTKGLTDIVRAAKRVTVAESIAESQKWLRERGFNKTESELVPLLAERASDIGSSGDPTNLWDLVAAGTAYARELQHQDVRVQKEQQFGALLDRYAPVR